MRAFLLALAILLAAAATGGFLWLSSRPAKEAPREEEPAPSPPEAAPDPLAPRTLRRWQTTATLVEDLRDALADPASDLVAEWRRVSEALLPHAAWVLENLAREEPSPRVRALVVLAAGVHLPESEELARFLEDREECVRRAAACARGGDAAAFVASLRR